MNTKKLLIIICILANQFFNTVIAQAPQSFNYQAVARDASGAVLSNQAVSFRISLLQGSATGTNVYSETHPITTNQFGLVNFAIGGGTIVSGSFANINWAQGPYFAQVELDATGGSTYVIMNTTQLLSVPYAQYAEKSGNPTLQAGSGITIQNDSIINTAQNQQVNLSGTGQTNITGTYPNYIVNTPNIQAGNGISVTGQTITNTAPDQTVTINGTGQTNVTGTYPNFTVNTPPYIAGTGINISGTNISAQNTNAIWNANKLQNINLDTLTPLLNNVLKFDGSKWKPSPTLPPMTTAQRDAITNPYIGMTFLNTNTDCIEYYNGVRWLGLCGEEGNIGNSLFGGGLQGGNAALISENTSVSGGEYLFTLNNKAYFKLLISGVNTFWEWNPINNLWTQKTTPSYWGEKASQSNLGYMFKASYNNGPNSASYICYNPITNLWTSSIDLNLLPASLSYGNPIAINLGAFLCSDSANIWFYGNTGTSVSANTGLYKVEISTNNVTLVSGYNTQIQPQSPHTFASLSPNKILYSSSFGIIEFDLQNPSFNTINTSNSNLKICLKYGEILCYKNYSGASNIFPPTGTVKAIYNYQFNSFQQGFPVLDSIYYNTIFVINNHLYSLVGNEIYELF
jgi:hypothetical protein